MNPSRVVSFGVCFALFLDFAQTVVCFTTVADAWLWKKCLASVSIELGFLTVFAERDISTLVVSVVVSIFLLADSLSGAVFASLCVASFLVHYFIETLVDDPFRFAAICFFVPSVVMAQTMHLPPAVRVEAPSVPLYMLALLFAVQTVLKWFARRAC